MSEKHREDGIGNCVLLNQRAGQVMENPDPSLDAKWLKEAESRLAAHNSRELAALDAEQVFAELGKRI